MSESRLFKIIYYLLNNGHATAPELSKEFDVSVRTIYRDIESLSEAGIPVYSEQGRNGGIYIVKDFVLDKALLSQNEKQEILGALQSLSVVRTGTDKDVLSKLSALFKVNTESWFEVDFSRWGNTNTDNEKFEAIKKAVIHHFCMSIEYESSSSGNTTRKIHPLKLLYKSKSWYIKAFCPEKKEFRLFKLSRIMSYKIESQTFIPVEYPEYTYVESSVKASVSSSEKDSSNRENANPIFRYRTIILKFPKEMAFRVYDEFDNTQVLKEKDGSLVVTTKMPEDQWLVGYILSFGKYVDVIEPVELKKYVSDAAKEIWEKMQNE